MSDQELKPGDVVELCGGSVPMTIASLDGETVTVMWTCSDGTLERLSANRAAFRPYVSAASAPMCTSEMYVRSLRSLLARIRTVENERDELQARLERTERDAAAFAGKLGMLVRDNIAAFQTKTGA